MSWFKNNDRELELAYLNKIIHIVCTLRVEVSKLHTEVRDLRAETTKKKFSDDQLVPLPERIHRPPAAPKPYHMPEKKWWAGPWKTSLG